MIEILVVVAIIALLIAILLPALSRARVQARSVQCQSNLKQQGYAALMYANDNKGLFPGCYTDAIERLPWDTELGPPIITGFRRAMIYVYKLRAIADVFYCPANKIRPWTTDNFFMHTGAKGVGGDSGRIQYWWVANPPIDPRNVTSSPAYRFLDTNGRWADGRTCTVGNTTSEGWDDEYMVRLDQRWPQVPPGLSHLSPDKVTISTDQSRQADAGWYFVHGGESLPTRGQNSAIYDKPFPADTIHNSWKNNLYADLHVSRVLASRVAKHWGPSNPLGW